MSDAPVYRIDPVAFTADPYPDLAAMRALAPAVYVPSLGATLLTRRDDIAENEKRVAVFSSVQPDGLMTRLMGQNMMRKDGEDHRRERAAIFPAVSPRTVQDVWRPMFEAAADAILDRLDPRGRADVVADYAMPLSAEALKAVTGLAAMDWQVMDRVSQAMIDGCANYGGDPQVEAACHDATATIDRAVDAAIAAGADTTPNMIAAQLAGGLDADAVRANIRLAISGGQNEPRDAIAGTIWALLDHPDQLAQVLDGQATWLQAFEEYARWQSPIGMSPRQIAQTHRIGDSRLDPGDRAFLMFGAGNRDPRVFSDPDRFDLLRDTGRALTFGAGPHFCAGAWISRTLIAEVALPKFFDRFRAAALAGPVVLSGWAFRGPLSVPVRWR